MTLIRFSDQKETLVQEFLEDFASTSSIHGFHKSHDNGRETEFWKKLGEINLPIKKEFWILKDNRGTCLGRISTNLSPYYVNTGYIGAFEAKDFQAAQILVKTALAWLSQHGVKKAYGPISFNTWFPYRFRVQKEDHLQFSFEPSHPPEYPDWFLSLGFKISAAYHSDGMDGITGIRDGTQSHFEKAISLGFSFRAFDQQNLLDRDVPILYEISMKSFQQNFLFEPIPFPIFKALYVPIANQLNLRFSQFLCNPSGKEVGFFYNFFESEHLIMKTTALLPEYRGIGLSNALFHSVTKAAHLEGVKFSVAALMKEGIQSESYTRKQHILWRHRYCLFEKEL